MEHYIPALLQTELFSGIEAAELPAMLQCMNARVKRYPKDSYILRAGSCIQQLGVLVSGSVLMVQEDIWGYRNILTILQPGETFGEPFAASGEIPLNVNVVADTDCEAVLLRVDRVLTVCSNSCGFHHQIIRNLVSILAKKLLMFNEKITYISKRTTRDKLLSYFSAQAQRQGSLEFTIPFDRQELADFLCVERAAMSAVLSGLKAEGLLDYSRSHFILHPENPEVSRGFANNS